MPAWSQPHTKPAVPPPAPYKANSNKKSALERSYSTPQLVGLPPTPAMARSSSASTLVGMEAHRTLAASVQPKGHPKQRLKQPSKSTMDPDDEPWSMTSDESSSAASPRSKTTKRRVSRTPEERKQRRLETNRAAAKRAYYRRQGKMNATQHDNDHLRRVTALQADRIRVYEAVLREAGYDPETVLNQSFAVTARTQSQHSKRDGMQDTRAGSDDDGDDDAAACDLPTKNATRTRRGRAVRRAKP